MSQDDGKPQTVSVVDHDPDLSKIPEQIRGLVERMLEKKIVCFIGIGCTAEDFVAVGYIGPPATLIPLYEQGGDALAAMVRNAMTNRDMNG